MIPEPRYRRFPENLGPFSGIFLKSTWSRNTVVEGGPPANSMWHESGDQAAQGRLLFLAVMRR